MNIYYLLLTVQYIFIRKFFKTSFYLIFSTSLQQTTLKAIETHLNGFQE